MITTTEKGPAYARVPDDVDDDISIRSHQKHSTTDTVCRLVPWLLLTIVSLAYTTHWYIGLQRHNSPCFDETLLDAPIIWEENTYISDIDGPTPDIYSVRNPEVDAAWSALQFTHMTAISADEKAHLPGHRETGVLYGGQDGYAVILEVFHQLHCLDSIRRAFYGNGTETKHVVGFHGPKEHIDHCFSYLVQMIRCHADVGVMTTRWVESIEDFAAYFNVTRQCRNFDTIWDWAKGRRTQFDTPGQIRRQGHEHDH